MFLNKEVHTAFEVKYWPDAFNKEVHAAFEVHAGRVNFRWTSLYKEVHAAVGLDKSLIHVSM